MTSKHLTIMGIEIWREKAPKTKNNSLDTKPLPKTNPDQNKEWQALHQEIKNCKKCELCKSRTQIVFGVGNKNAELMLIGEAPGANEDLKGEPFVGRAGMLLNEMLKSISLKREDVYIANILKCRPPMNRDPLPSEVKSCTPYLLQQISLIKPKLIVAVGRIAAQFLLNTTESMRNLRGGLYKYGPENTPLLITYHPAYLLRSPKEKAKAYQDILLIKKKLFNI